jgi:hypothetical protein
METCIKLPNKKKSEIPESPQKQIIKLSYTKPKSSSSLAKGPISSSSSPKKLNPITAPLQKSTKSEVSSGPIKSSSGPIKSSTESEVALGPIKSSAKSVVPSKTKTKVVVPETQAVIPVEETQAITPTQVLPADSVTITQAEEPPADTTGFFDFLSSKKATTPVISAPKEIQKDSSSTEKKTAATKVEKSKIETPLPVAANTQAKGLISWFNSSTKVEPTEKQVEVESKTSPSSAIPSTGPTAPEVIVKPSAAIPTPSTSSPVLASTKTTAAEVKAKPAAIPTPTKTTPAPVLISSGPVATQIEIDKKISEAKVAIQYNESCNIMKQTMGEKKDMTEDILIIFINRCKESKIPLNIFIIYNCIVENNYNLKFIASPTKNNILSYLKELINIPKINKKLSDFPKKTPTPTPAINLTEHPSESPSETSTTVPSETPISKGSEEKNLGVLRSITNSVLALGQSLLGSNPPEPEKKNDIIEADDSTSVIQKKIQLEQDEALARSLELQEQSKIEKEKQIQIAEDAKLAKSLASPGDGNLTGIGPSLKLKERDHKLEEAKGSEGLIASPIDPSRVQKRIKFLEQKINIRPDIDEISAAPGGRRLVGKPMTPEELRKDISQRKKPQTTVSTITQPIALPNTPPPAKPNSLWNFLTGTPPPIVTETPKDSESKVITPEISYLNGILSNTDYALKFDIIKSQYDSLTPINYYKIEDGSPKCINNIPGSPPLSSYLRDYVINNIGKINISPTEAKLFIPVSINTINTKYSSYTLTETSSKAKFFNVIGVDALLLPYSQLSINSISQIASQYNFLEAPNNNYFEITNYYSDSTQGPRASLSCLISLIIRDLLFKRVNDSSKQLVDSQRIFNNELFNNIYKNGYLTLEQFGTPLTVYENVLQYLTSNKDNLNIFAQWGIPELWKDRPFSIKDNGLLQVFTAAPSLQHINQYSPEGLEIINKPININICKLLVSLQYEAIGKLAVMRCIETNASETNPIRIHLTAVGQGSFNNHISVMSDSFDKFFNVIKNYNIIVYFHTYQLNIASQGIINIIEGLARNHNINIHENMSAKTFYNFQISQIEPVITAKASIKTPEVEEKQNIIITVKEREDSTDTSQLTLIVKNNSCFISESDKNSVFEDFRKLKNKFIDECLQKFIKSTTISLANTDSAEISIDNTIIFFKSWKIQLQEIYLLYEYYFPYIKSSTKPPQYILSYPTKYPISKYTDWHWFEEKYLFDDSSVKVWVLVPTLFIELYNLIDGFIQYVAIKPDSYSSLKKCLAFLLTNLLINNESKFDKIIKKKIKDYISSSSIISLSDLPSIKKYNLYNYIRNINNLCWIQYPIFTKQTSWIMVKKDSELFETLNQLALNFVNKIQKDYEIIRLNDAIKTITSLNESFREHIGSNNILWVINNYNSTIKDIIDKYEKEINIITIKSIFENPNDKANEGNMKTFIGKFNLFLNNMKYIKNLKKYIYITSLDTKQKDDINKLIRYYTYFVDKQTEIDLLLKSKKKESKIIIDVQHLCNDTMRFITSYNTFIQKFLEESKTILKNKIKQLNPIIININNKNNFIYEIKNFTEQIINLCKYKDIKFKLNTSPLKGKTDKSGKKTNFSLESQIKYFDKEDPDNIDYELASIDEDPSTDITTAESSSKKYRDAIANGKSERRIIGGKNKTKKTKRNNTKRKYNIKHGKFSIRKKNKLRRYTIRNKK